jgi:hypothetical protein
MSDSSSPRHVHFTVLYEARAVLIYPKIKIQALAIGAHKEYVQMYITYMNP